VLTVFGCDDWRNFDCSSGVNPKPHQAFGCYHFSAHSVLCCCLCKRTAFALISDYVSNVDAGVHAGLLLSTADRHLQLSLLLPHMRLRIVTDQLKYCFTSIAILQPLR
jgi:hypothetical protein